MKALPRLKTGPSFIINLLSPSSPCRNTIVVPEDKDAVALFYFSGDNGGFARERHPRTLNLDRIALLNLRVESFDIPFRAEMNGDCLFVRFEHNMNA